MRGYDPESEVYVVTPEGRLVAVDRVEYESARSEEARKSQGLPPSTSQSRLRAWNQRRLRELEAYSRAQWS